MYKLHILNINCNWLYFFVYSDKEMTKVPETVNKNSLTELRLIALMPLPTLVILIVIALIIFQDLFTRLYYLASMVDVVSTEDDDDDDEPSRVNVATRAKLCVKAQ